MDEHTHIGKTYSVNNEIVCKDCHPKEVIGNNECFCNCHANGQAHCSRCVRLHIPAGD